MLHPRTISIVILCPQHFLNAPYLCHLPCQCCQANATVVAAGAPAVVATGHTAIMVACGQGVWTAAAVADLPGAADWAEMQPSQCVQAMTLAMIGLSRYPVALMWMTERQNHQSLSTGALLPLLATHPVATHFALQDAVWWPLARLCPLSLKMKRGL